MLILVLVLPIARDRAAVLDAGSGAADGRKLTRAERQAQPPSRTERAALRLLPYVPSEMYYRAAKNAPSPADAGPAAGRAGDRRRGRPAGRLRRLPARARHAGESGHPPRGSFGGLWNRVIPGLSPAASAVAFTQLRLALRSPRGRATIGSPLLMPLVLAGLGYQRGGLPIPGVQGHYGLALAAMGCFAAILGLIPISMNQFAIDKAGFTRSCCRRSGSASSSSARRSATRSSPPGPMLFCFVLPALILPGGSPALWLALALAVARDLRAARAGVGRALGRLSQGRRPQQHRQRQQRAPGRDAAGHAGVRRCRPRRPPCWPSSPIGWLHRPRLAPLFLLAWCALAFGISYLLFIPVRRLVASRCETLAQYCWLAAIRARREARGRVRCEV